MAGRPTAGKPTAGSLRTPKKKSLMRNSSRAVKSLVHKSQKKILNFFGPTDKKRPTDLKALFIYKVLSQG
jgi:hypothetical protein